MYIKFLMVDTKFAKASTRFDLLFSNLVYIIKELSLLRTDIVKWREMFGKKLKQFQLQ